MKKLKVAAVSYLNTKPFLYGLFKTGLDKEIELQLEIPSVCAQKMRSGEVDLGLIPVAAIPDLASPYIFSDYCIGAVGAVKTVCIYSQRPIEELTHIYLDFHSRTSVALTRILLRDYWQLSPKLLPSDEGYISKLNDRVGGLVIGDRAMDLEGKFPFVYDLGAIWQQLTGLPFVFAAWISNTTLSRSFVERFNRALAIGLANIPELLLLLPKTHPTFDLATYFQRNISYHLDDSKRQALQLFLTKMKNGQPIKLQNALVG